MRRFVFQFALALLAIPYGSTASAQGGGELPGGDDGGPQVCWNCVSEIHDGVTYNLCKHGGLTGYAGCVGGGSGAQSNCTNSAFTCPSTDDHLMAANSLSRDGFSVLSRRLTLASIESRERGAGHLLAEAGEKDCKGFVVSLQFSPARPVAQQGDGLLSLK